MPRITCAIHVSPINHHKEKLFTGIHSSVKSSWLGCQ